ncbi:O-antigen ligase family protein [Pectobacterium odoriferum]|nr:O-antigen ligase family protein [Pectobacterium odoriferum]
MIKLSSSFATKISIWLILARSPFFVFFMALFFIVNNKSFFVFIKNIIPFFLLVVLSVLYSLVQGNEFSYVFGQAKDILLAVVIFLFLVAYSLSKSGGDRFIFDVIKNGFVFIAVAKIIILLYSFYYGVSPVDVIDNISDFWGVEMMTLGVEGSSMTRIQIPIDAAGPLVIFFTLHRILNSNFPLKDVIQFFLLIFSCLLTMSRFFWAESAFFIILCFLINMKSKKHFFLLSVLLVISFVLFFLTPLGETINTILGTRFDALINSSSDSTRVLQIAEINSAIRKSPIFGHGIGYYIPHFIRSDEIKYLYENQTLSMIMSLGGVGAFVLLVMIVVNVFNNSAMRCSTHKNIILTVLFFIFWLLSGSFNPLLFGASGGIVLFFSTRNSYILNDFK